jgi:phosphate-selective porin O/P
MTRRKQALSAWFALLLASTSAPAFEVPTGREDFTLEVEPLIQPRTEVDFDGPIGSAAPSGHANIDFYIRRARLLVRGTAYKQFSFGLNIVALRIGERGNLNVSPFVQDIRVGYMPAQDVTLETGLLLMPLTHAAVEGAGYQSSIDGAGNILLYNNARQLRETGIQIRALLLDRRVLVRGGFYEGARNTNPPTAPALNPNGIPLVEGWSG